MARGTGKQWKVGLTVIVALAVGIVAVFLIGEQANLFRRKASYFVMFNNVGGLNAGNPVQLNGVDVGRVTEVILPEEPGENDIRVWLTVDRRYADRVRQDSEAKIKTLGLLGDKFIEITSGSLQFPPVDPDGGQIATAPATSLDELLATGEGLMDNVMSISFSLRNILARMEEGEGLLGQLTRDTPEGERLTTSIVGTMETIERVAETVEHGQGPLPRMLNDPELATSMEASLARLESVLAKVDEGDGALPMLLNDPESAARVEEALASLSAASRDLAALVERVESSEGLMQRLLLDEEYGREVGDKVREIVDRIDEVSREVTEGEGTVAQLIHDPAVYEAVQDILVGIDESRILRWLIRNRQQKGIEARYEDAVEEGEVPPLPRGQEVPPVEEPFEGPGDPAAPPVDEPPPGDPAREEPPAEDPPGDVPPAGDPPPDEPPVEGPPAEPAPAGAAAAGAAAGPRPAGGAPAR